MKLRGYDINSQLSKLNYIQSLSKDEFYDFQLKRKWEIARFHYENNFFYRQKVGNFFPNVWEDLPILTKKDYHQNIENNLTQGYHKKNIYFGNTSGSSSTPLFFAKNKSAHAMDWALIKNRYSKHNINLGSLQSRFFGVLKYQKKKITEKFKNYIMNRENFSITDFTNHIKNFKCNPYIYIYGYTNTLVLFAKYLSEKKVILKEICPTLIKCIVTSEILTSDDRKELSRNFGVEIINEYGTSESGILAFESLPNKLVLSEENIFFETNNNYQEIGDIIITDYDNLAMPFIRYDIGDIGRISNIYSSIYPNNRILENLSGRKNDLIHIGKKVLPGFILVKAFEYFFADYFSNDNNPIREFVFIQKTMDSFILDIVIDRSFTIKEKKIIIKLVKKSLNSDVFLTINKVNSIERPKSGKMKQFYSEII